MSDGQMTAASFNARLIRQVERIRAAEEEWRKAIATWAQAERLYKMGEALARASIAPDSYKNAGERDARAELLDLEPLSAEMPAGANVNSLRFVAHQSEQLMGAAKVACQHRGSELSALQSEAALAKQEAVFEKYAPSEAVGP